MGLSLRASSHVVAHGEALHLVANMKIRVDLNDDGETIDDLVYKDVKLVRVEQMSDGLYWMAFDGDHFHFTSDSPIDFRLSWSDDDDGDYEQNMSQAGSTE